MHVPVQQRVEYKPPVVRNVITDEMIRAQEIKKAQEEDDKLRAQEEKRRLEEQQRHRVLAQQLREKVALHLHCV